MGSSVRAGGVHAERRSRGAKVRGRRGTVRVRAVSKKLGCLVLAKSQRLKVSEVNC